MDTASRKAKGRRFQQWVKDKLISILNVEEINVISRSMGVKGSDVYITIPGKFPFGIEVKNQEANKLIYDWYDQAVSNTGVYDEPLLFIKKNQHKPLVVIDAEFFIQLYAKFRIS
jgi:hypothetical protein